MENIRTTVNETPVSDEAKITFNVKSNPKREGSKAHARFQNYMKARTVAEYLELGGTTADLKYDWEKSFIEVANVDRAE